jgi:HK97 family phage portal protein
MAGVSLKERWNAVKSAMRFPGYGSNYANHYIGAWGNRGVIDFAANAGDPMDNSIVAATLGWIGRTYPEAPIRIMRETAKGEEAVPGHPLGALLKRPNPYYSGAQMWTPLMMSYILDGNAYLIKERTLGGGVLALWYVPHWTMEPRWPADGSVFIDHYDYKVDGKVTQYAVEDVVHLPNGRDPKNMRKGLSQLKAALREIYTDNEITQYEAAMVQNRGTPGAIISPMTADQTLSEKEAAWVSENYFEKTTGANRGKPIVSLAAINVATPSFSPADMNLRQMRWTPEERISALIGIPAIVVGLGAGLEHATFANYQQAREAAYESFLMPVQSIIDEELTTQLMPDFGGDPALRVAHDYNDVRVLQPDLDAVFARVEKVFAGSIIDRATAKRELKFDVQPDDEGVYLLARGASFVSGELTDVGPAVDPLAVGGENVPEDTGGDVPVPALPAKPTNGASKTPIPAATKA